MAHAQCVEDVATVRGEFGQANFKIDVADEPEERAQGLMFVESMPTLAGMLFVYEQPQRATFWMRNTLISLDMLFADETGVINRIHPDAIPGDETTIDGGDNVSAVLEINGGLAARLGISVGDTIQHPSFGAEAADPC
ncbi:MAG: DUF192 domain-containing protein [Pseudomonadota bacterium]